MVSDFNCHDICINLGKSVEDVCMSTLGGQVDRREAVIVLVSGRHSVLQHQLDGLDVSALCGEVQRRILVESVPGVRHQSLVHSEHRLQHVSRTFLGSEVGEGVAVLGGAGYQAGPSLQEQLHQVRVIVLSGQVDRLLIRVVVAVNARLQLEQLLAGLASPGRRRQMHRGLLFYGHPVQRGAGLHQVGSKLRETLHQNSS